MSHIPEPCKECARAPMMMVGQPFSLSLALQLSPVGPQTINHLRDEIAWFEYVVVTLHASVYGHVYSPAGSKGGHNERHCWLGHQHRIL